jgi:hypothetical protein
MTSYLNLGCAFRSARLAVAAIALSLLLAPTLPHAQVATLRPRGQAASGQDKASARIVLVEWRIRKGHGAEFLKYWSIRATIEDRLGLIGEFLSKVEDQKQFPWMTWSLDRRWTTFVNVGFWREGADFQQQIGLFIDNQKPLLAFEAQRRRRVFLAPERWRMGATPLYLTDHPNVR